MQRRLSLCQVSVLQMKVKVMWQLLSLSYGFHKLSLASYRQQGLRVGRKVNQGNVKHVIYYVLPRIAPQISSSFHILFFHQLNDLCLIDFKIQKSKHPVLINIRVLRTLYDTALQLSSRALYYSEFKTHRNCVFELICTITGLLIKNKIR